LQPQPGFARIRRSPGHDTIGDCMHRSADYPDSPRGLATLPAR
jgi:hypothetical protein